jgi:hypothetical protein
VMRRTSSCADESATSISECCFVSVVLFVAEVAALLLVLRRLAASSCTWVKLWKAAVHLFIPPAASLHDKG